MIGWFIDLLFKLWSSFWNVVSKLFGYAFLAAAIAVVVAAGAKIFTGRYELSTAIFIGGFCAAVKLLINEVAVPLLWEQEKRERERRMRELNVVAERSKTKDRDWSTRRF